METGPEHAAEQLNELWQRWQQTYVRLNPPPERPAAAARGLHWTVVVMLAAALALGVGVSFRTALAFYSAAVAQGGDWTAWGEALVFVFGVEGGMAAFGFRHAYRAALDGKAEGGWYARFLAVAQWAGLAILVAVSALAGLWQAFALGGDAFGPLRERVLFWLAALMGAGASIAVFLLFEFAGAEAARGIVLAERRNREWREAMQAWRDQMRSAFEAQPGVRRLLQLAYGRRAAAGAEYAVGEPPRARSSALPRRDPVKLRRALQWIAERYEPGQTVDTPRREIAREVGASPALVQQAVNLWQEDPNAALAILDGRFGRRENAEGEGQTGEDVV